MLPGRRILGFINPGFLFSAWNTALESHERRKTKEEHLWTRTPWMLRRNAPPSPGGFTLFTSWRPLSAVTLHDPCWRSSAASSQSSPFLVVNSNVWHNTLVHKPHPLFIRNEICRGLREKILSQFEITAVHLVLHNFSLNFELPNLSRIPPLSSSVAECVKESKRGQQTAM